MKEKAPRFQDDIIDDILRRVIEMAPTFNAAIAKQISEDARREWAGERVRFYYIARRDDDMRTRRNESIRRDYLAGERLGLLARRYGVSERRIIQIVKAK